MSSLLDLIGPLVLDVRLAVLTPLLLSAAFIDIKQHRVPNLLVLFGLCFAILYNGIHPPRADDNGWLFAIQGTLVGFLIFMPLYLVRAMGAGDVKLMSMVGAFLGPLGAFSAALTTFVVGGILAVIVLLWKRSAGRAVRNLYYLLTANLLTAPAGSIDLTISGADSAGKLPYAVAIAAGTLIYLLLRALGHVG